MVDCTSGKSILLVEDEALIGLAEKNLLESCGYIVSHVFSGEAAVEYAEQPDFSCDLILMDIDLGDGIDGTETARRILKNKDIPVVFLSSHTEPEIVEKTETITSYGYVVKNSGITILDASIKMAFKLYKEKCRVQDKQSELLHINEKLNAANEEVIKRGQLLKNKIDKIFNPDTEISGLELKDIIDIETVQSLLDKMYLYTGMVIALVDLKGSILAMAGWQDICVKFHRVNERTRANCTESDLFFASNLEQGEIKKYKCKNGMWDVVTPLFIGEKHVGNIFTGQFFYNDDVVDESFFMKQAGKYGFDKEEYLKALRKVPRFKDETIKTFMLFLVDFFKLVSRLSYSNLLLAKSASDRFETVTQAEGSKDIL